MKKSNELILEQHNLCENYGKWYSFEKEEYCRFDDFIKSKEVEGE